MNLEIENNNDVDNINSLANKQKKLKDSFEQNLQLIQDRDHDIESLENKLDQQLSIINEKDESIISLKKQINILKNSNEENESNQQCKISSIKSENIELKQSLANCKKDLSTTQNELDALHSDYQDRLNSMEQEQRQSIENVEEDMIQKNKFNHQQLENQNLEFKEKLKVSDLNNQNQNEVIEKYKNELKSNEILILRLNTEINQLKDLNNIQLKKFTFEIEKLSSEKNQLKSEIDYKNNTINNFDGIYSEFKNEYDDHKQSLKVFQENKMSDMKDHIEKETLRIIESHSEELTNLKSDLYEKTHLQDQSLLEIDSLQNEVKLNKQNQESKIKGMECEIELSKKMNDMTVNNLSNQCNKLKNEIKNNLSTIEQLQSNNSQLNQNNDNLVRKEEELINKYENLMRINQEKYESRLFETEQKFNNAVKEKVDLNENLIDVRIKMKEIEKNNEELNNDLSELQKNFETKHKELDKIRRELNSKEKYQSNNFNKLKESIKTVKKNMNTNLTNNSNFDQTKLDDLLNFDEIENQLEDSNLLFKDDNLRIKKNVDNKIYNEQELLDLNERSLDKNSVIEHTQIFDLQNENEELKSVVEEMTNMIGKLKSELDTQKQKIDFDVGIEKDSQVIDLKNKLLVHERDQDILKNECNKQIDLNEQLTKEVDRLKSDLKDDELKISDIIAQRTTLENINFKIKKETIQLKRQIKELKVQYEGKMSSVTNQNENDDIQQNRPVMSKQDEGIYRNESKNNNIKDDTENKNNGDQILKENHTEFQSNIHNERFLKK